MFSGQDNSYPLSSYQLSPSSFTIPHESNNIIPQDSFTHFPFLLNPPISETSILNHVMLSSSTANSSFEASIGQESSGKAPTTTKKDRHTKISTAQGVRDRRVRLSIDIAREFFSLQDMLGFDKASKTLGWLLSKSKVAIDELTDSLKSGGTPNSSSSSQVEDDQGHVVLGANRLSSKNKREKREGNRNGESVEREMRRAKARERARERTDYKKKMVMNVIGNDHPNYDQRAQHNLMNLPQSCSGDAPYNYNNSSYGMTYNQHEIISIEQQQQQLSKNESHFRGMWRDADVTDKHKLRLGSSSYNHNCDQIYPRFDDQEIFNNHYNNDYLMKLALECNNSNIHPHGISASNVIDQSTEIHMNTKQIWDNHGKRTQ